jgi:hypothetical protein
MAFRPDGIAEVQQSVPTVTTTTLNMAAACRVPSSLSDWGFDLREVIGSAANRAVSPASIGMAAALAWTGRLTELATRFSGGLSRC